MLPHKQTIIVLALLTTLTTFILLNQTNTIIYNKIDVTNLDNNLQVQTNDHDHNL